MTNSHIKSIDESSNTEEDSVAENNHLETRRKMTNEEKLNVLARVQKIHKNAIIRPSHMNRVFSQDTFVRVRKQASGE
jgi:hypothetical protein